MRVTTLGTSHGDPTPCRFSTSTLVESGGAGYLIDAGAPVHALLIRAGKALGAVRAAFITHMHEDHVAGLPSLLKTLLKYPDDAQPLDVFLPEARAMEALGAWIRALRRPWPSSLVDVHLTAAGEVYADGRATVSAEVTRHLPPEGGCSVSFAYVVEAEGKRVVVTGDLSGDFGDFPAAALRRPSDLVVCEATHYPPETALPVLAKCPIRWLVLNHVGNPWHGEGEAKLRAIFATLPYPVDVAHDGDEFVV